MILDLKIEKFQGKILHFSKVNEEIQFHHIHDFSHFFLKFELLSF